MPEQTAVGRAPGIVGRAQCQVKPGKGSAALRPVPGRWPIGLFAMGIHLGPKLLTKASTLLVVVHDSVMEIGYGERVIFNSHSETPAVRRKNSA